MDMQRGMRDRLEKYVNPAQPIEVQLEVSGGAVYEFCCIGVNSQKKLSNPGYLIFYNRQRSPNGDITTVFPSSNAARFTIKLDELPEQVDRLVFTASIDGNGTMSQASLVEADVGQNGEYPLQFREPGTAFSNEKAVIMLEVYRKDGWRVMAVGRGMNGGLHELLATYDAQDALEVPPEPQPVPEVSPQTQPAPQASSGKVVLKKGQKVNLKKSNTATGEILINLNWSQPAPKKHWFGVRQQSIDLDLGCLFEMKDGRKGCVQALGNSFGSLTQFPYISLDGDDRSGAATTGENLRVNMAKVSEIQRVLIYTFIYEGVANWKDADGVVTVKCPGNPEIIVHMDEYGTKQAMCAIAMLENTGGDSFSIEKLVRFFSGHEAMDKAYHWGMRWVPGTKD